MKVLNTEKPLNVFLKASKLLNDAVAHTLGPNGGNTAVVLGAISNLPRYSIINDGKVIVDNLTSEDPWIAPALETLKESAKSTNKTAGDGTTSTIIMTNALLKECNKLINPGKSLKNKLVSHDPMKIKNDLKKIKKELLENLEKNRKIISKCDYKSVATIAMGSTDDVDKIVEAFTFAGVDGVVTLDKTSYFETMLDKSDGIPLDKIRLAADQFITIEGRSQKTFKDCSVVVIKNHIARFAELLPLLELLQKVGKSIVMFYDTMSQDAKETLYRNFVGGKLDICPVSLTQYGIDKEKIYSMLEVTCKLKAIDQLELKLDKVTLENIGNSQSIRVEPDYVIIRPKDTKGFKKWCEDTENEFSSKSVIVEVGAKNQIELEEKYRRVEDTINSLRNAIKTGIVPGGGVMYQRLNESLSEDVPNYIRKSMDTVLNSVYRQNMENCGIKITDDTDGRLPKDISSGELEMFLPEEISVYDAAAVVEQVITNSFDIVCSVLTVQAMVAENVR